jgi:hypothetical protein
MYIKTFSYYFQYLDFLNIHAIILKTTNLTNSAID